MIETRKLFIHTEKSLTILPRILLAFSRRRIDILEFHVREVQGYEIDVLFDLPSDRSDRLLQQIENMEEVISARLEILAATKRERLSG